MENRKVINWNEYFMAITILAKSRSKDPFTQVGALIVKDKRILSIGYNGSPSGLPDDIMKWERIGDKLDTKYPYMIHAEVNAVLNFRGNLKDLDGATLYVTLFPCNECAKFIIQSGIKKVIYLEDKYEESDEVKASKWLFSNCGVEFFQYKSENKQEVVIEF